MIHNANLSACSLLVPILLLLYGCGSDSEAPPPDCGSSNLQASVNNIQDAGCGQENGSFDLTVSGSAPFELTLSGLGSQPVQTGVNTIEDIPSGNYTLTVRDDNNCTVSSNVTISNTNNVTIGTQIQASGCQTANGAITVTANGGVEPYMYSLDGGAMQGDNMFTGLSAGDYTTLVSDADDCQSSVTVSVLSGVSYSNTIATIISTNCAINTCHDGSNGAAPNWTNLATVQANAENIKTMTSNQTMPPAGRPDLQPQEIQAIACWVDDGAPDN